MLAERLRSARSTLRMSQEKAAADMGVALVTLARWETGSQRPRGLAARFVELWIAQALGEEASLGT